MKNLLKVTFIVVALFIAGGLSAQAVKIGYVNSQELISMMPEVKDAQTKLEKLGKELQDELDAMQVEFSKKLQDYQAKAASLSENIRSDKENELQEMRTRIQTRDQAAQQDFTKEQQKLYQPIIEKAQNAIKKVGKETSCLFVFDSSQGVMLYYDLAVCTDLTAALKKELNIPANAVPQAGAATPPAN